MPVYVTGRLGLNNAWAGLAVGVAFLATILTRPTPAACRIAEAPRRRCGAAWFFTRRGAGLDAGGLPMLPPVAAYLILIAGRLLLGVGESLVIIGVIAWGVGFVGPARSGRVLAFVGAAMYGALAVGGPVGLVLMSRLGFAGAMAVSALLPCLGLLAIWRMSGVAPHAQDVRPSFLSLMGQIGRHGLIICLQGIGFAAIGAFLPSFSSTGTGAAPGLA